MILLLFIYSFCCSHCVLVCDGSSFCGVVLGALLNLAIILLKKREMVAVCVLCFLCASWFGMQSMIMALWHFLVILTNFFIESIHENIRLQQQLSHHKQRQ